jgi:hypothetical protein
LKSKISFKIVPSVKLESSKTQVDKHKLKQLVDDYLNAINNNDARRLKEISEVIKGCSSEQKLQFSLKLLRRRSTFRPEHLDFDLTPREYAILLAKIMRFYKYGRCPDHLGSIILEVLRKEREQIADIVLELADYDKKALISWLSQILPLLPDTIRSLPKNEFLTYLIKDLAESFPLELALKLDNLGANELDFLPDDFWFDTLKRAIFELSDGSKTSRLLGIAIIRISKEKWEEFLLKGLDILWKHDFADYSQCWFAIEFLRIFASFVAQDYNKKLAFQQLLWLCEFYLKKSENRECSEIKTCKKLADAFAADGVCEIQASEMFKILLFLRSDWPEDLDGKDLSRWALSMWTNSSLATFPKSPNSLRLIYTTLLDLRRQSGGLDLKVIVEEDALERSNFHKTIFCLKLLEAWLILARETGIENPQDLLPDLIGMAKVDGKFTWTLSAHTVNLAEKTLRQWVSTLGIKYLETRAKYPAILEKVGYESLENWEETAVIQIESVFGSFVDFCIYVARLHSRGGLLGVAGVQRLLEFIARGWETQKYSSDFYEEKTLEIWRQDQIRIDVITIPASDNLTTLRSLTGGLAKVADSPQEFEAEITNIIKELGNLEELSVEQVRSELRSKVTNVLGSSRPREEPEFLKSSLRHLVEREDFLSNTELQNLGLAITLELLDRAEEFKLPKDDRNRLKQIKALIKPSGSKEKKRLAVSLVTGHPNLLFRAGALVPGVYSCLDPFHGDHSLGVGGNVVEPGIKIGATYVVEHPDVIKLLEKSSDSVRLHFDPVREVLHVRGEHQEIIIPLKGKCRSRTFLRLGKNFSSGRPALLRDKSIQNLAEELKNPVNQIWEDLERTLIEKLEAEPAKPSDTHFPEPKEWAFGVWFEPTWEHYFDEPYVFEQHDPLANKFLSLEASNPPLREITKFDHKN